jgi:hypothetical protein
MTTRAKFESLVASNGSDVVFHREQGGTVCPCVSPEGYRDLTWHKTHPDEPLCNEQGRLDPVITNLTGKAFVQPVQSGATRRLTAEYIESMFDEVQADDHVGIFPLQFGSTPLAFENWDESGEDYILYNGRRFIVVSLNQIPAPDNGLPHHFEVGLRLARTERNI